ncbi:MAG: SAM-dependent methyltransferase [Terrimicrobiaceae bacterium]|nr:SAM-dependent methyltransferase [Terrimicrobiaceae bacterium]
MSAAIEFLLRLQAECGGVIPVERYLREALYHPEHGYYARNIRTVGRRGDFATSASLGEALGSALARWLWLNRLPAKRGAWHVIEAGAGTGELARTVLRRLGLLRRRGLVYHIVETSPVLREEQRRALPQYRVRWHESMIDALAECDGRAATFSNELIDAFPCQLFERREGAWIEVGVRIENGRVIECALDRPPPPSSAFAGNFADGQRVEVHASAAEWIASWAAAAREARMLTIDYGDTAPALYHRRPRGTLRAYFHHQRYEGVEVYHRFGRQDITCDVNFTDLRAWTEHCGWRTAALTTQAEFFATHGAVHASLHDAQLVDHTGAGAAFKVLVQEKGFTPRELPGRFRLSHRRVDVE